MPNNGAISYVLNGQRALNLIWNYNSDGEVVKDVYLYVVEGGKDVLVAAKYFPSGQYYVYPDSGYTNSRVEFSATATFTVKNIVPSDSRRFKCVINFNTPPKVTGAITSINSAVEVVVVGEYQAFFYLYSSSDQNCFSQVMILSFIGFY